MSYSLDFPYLLGQPVARGLLRSEPEDFRVDELLGFDLSGEGEHHYLQIEKRGANTAWLSKQIAQLAGVRDFDVGYAGLKDRHALTRQWFSVWLPGEQTVDWKRLESDEVRILQIGRHGRKLRTGGHLANRFCIRLRDLSSIEGLTSRLERVRDAGVPNYFGEQRFGIEGGNLIQADRLFSGGIRVRDKTKRGFYLSAARSYLFNLILAERVRGDLLGRYLPGDRLMLDGSTRLWTPESPEVTASRLTSMDVHPTGPLWGEGRALVETECLALENAVLAPFEPWCRGLERAGLKRERRSLRLPVRDLEWVLEGKHELELRFSLPGGCFATSVVREICDYQVATRPEAVVEGGSA
jgi:tRNA pseudouridine13 synthase